MVWDKINLVTQEDGSDVWKCSECNFKKKYFGVERENECPKCKKTDIYGGWMIKPSKCNWCNTILIKCPKDHPNAKYLNLKRYPNEDLYICPNNCLEDGSYIGKKFKHIYYRIII